MSVNLTKGGTVDLTKQAGGTLTKVRVGLGWDANAEPGAAFDLDASVFTLDASGKSIGAPWFVYFNNLSSPGAEIVHQGDERTGDTEGDDEQIVIDLSALPAEATELAIAVTIHEAAARGQSFASVKNASIRVIDETSGSELSRFDLSDDAGAVNALVFGSLHRDGSGWSFKATAEGSTGELAGLVSAYQV